MLEQILLGLSLKNFFIGTFNILKKYKKNDIVSNQSYFLYNFHDSLAVFSHAYNLGKGAENTLKIPLLT